MIRRLAIIAAFIGSQAAADGLTFPSNASLQHSSTQPLDSYVFPLGIWERGVMPTRRIEGVVTQQAWRIAAAGLTTLQLVRPLREQLRNDRYTVVFECQTEACGGFDFRFAIETLSPPDMQISLGDFRYLLAERSTGDGPEMIGLFVSRTAQAGFVQVTHVGPADDDGPIVAAAAPVAAPPVAIGPAVLTVQEQLQNNGRAVLADLTFETGSAQLAAQAFASLRDLAEYLAGNPTQTVVLVGHTDTDGDLAPNIALSKRRAASVVERLVTNYGTPRRQLVAEGIGFLAPLASNATAAGRDSNRRVEAVLAGDGN